MARQPTRLADFEMPRSAGVEPDLSATESLKPADTGKAAPTVDAAPMKIAPRPVAEARQAMTIRLPISMHERIRTLMFTSRRSQQEIVEGALDAFLAANEV